MRDPDCVRFLRAWLPRLGLRWQGYRKVRGTVCKRIDRRLRRLGLADLEDYAARLEGSPEERDWLDALCRIPVSRFYRDRGLYDRLAEHVLPELARQALARGGHLVRCWSAGCAAGQEPYGLAVVWRVAVLPVCPAVELAVIASDSDPCALQRAGRASYRAGTLKELPARYRQPAFDHAGDRFVLRPEFRQGLEWRLQDLRREMPAGPFDLVLCRNLAFTYFDAELQGRVLGGLAARLRSGGWLAIGSRECLPAHSPGFARDADGLPLYRKIVDA